MELHAGGTYPQTAPVASESQRAAEDLLHDLVGSAPDRAEPGIARRALDPYSAM